MIVFASDVDREQHIALVRGADRRPPLVRVHSHCLTGDAFGSTECDCHDIIEHSLEAIVAENRGVFVYLHQHGTRLRDRFHRACSRRPAAYSISLAQPSSTRTPHGNACCSTKSGIGAQILIDLGSRVCGSSPITRGRSSPSKAMA